jgi:hypothetical protein
MKSLELGCVAMAEGKNLSFSFGQYTTVFQAEVYVNEACTVENLDRICKHTHIYILSEALGKYQITSKLVRDCHQSLTQLARHNRVQLIWVPGHEGIVDNEMAHQLARTGSEHPFIGPEPACGISVGVAKKVVRDWMKRNHRKRWESVTGLKQVKDLY